MEDVSVLIQAVEGFKDTDNPWSDELERFIAHVARTGDILAPWEKVQKVFKNKLCLVLDEFYTMNPYKVGKVNANATNDDFDEMKKRLIQLAEEFDSPPFTIQRLCELLTDPRKNYTKCDKFMRGLEKNLMVVSSWNNTPRRASESNDAMVNGVSIGPSNGFIAADRLKPHWANLPPSPIATTPPKIPGAPDFTDISTVMPVEKATEQTVEQKEGQTTQENVADNTTASIEPQSEQPEEESEKKSNVSATIISSSPPKTINIKRKIDDSADEQTSLSEKDPSDQVEESPTKKLKSDAPEAAETEVRQQQQEEKDTLEEGEKGAEESPENKPELDVPVEADKPADSAVPKIDSAEIQTDSAAMKSDSTEMKSESAELTDAKTADAADSINTETQSDVKMDTSESSDEGTSVDPPPSDSKSEGEAQMDVD